jgi:hypothetical protein
MKSIALVCSLLCALVLSSCNQKNITPEMVNDVQSGEMADAEQSKVFENREL